MLVLAAHRRLLGRVLGLAERRQVRLLVVVVPPDRNELDIVIIAESVSLN